MAAFLSIRNAMEEMREAMTDVTEEVGLLGRRGEDTREELENMIRKQRNEIMSDVTPLGQAIAHLIMLYTNRDKGGGGKRNEMINAKGALPQKFAGKAEESFRSWSHDLKAYANAVFPGFRSVLTWAESSAEPVDEDALKLIEWDHLEAANSQLYDLLVTLTESEAKNMVLNVGVENGLEAYRKLSDWYDSYGKVNELERFNRLMGVSRCRTIGDVPRAVESWESDWSVYKLRTGEELPERLRTNTLLRMIPSDYEEEIRMRYAHSNVTYATLRQQLFEYAARKGTVQKHLGAVEGQPGDDLVWVDDADIDSLGLNRSKGKGKGKPGGKFYKKSVVQKFKAKGGAKGKGEFTGKCFFCQETGHRADACPSRPSIAKPVSSVESPAPSANNSAAHAEPPVEHT